LVLVGKCNGWKVLGNSVGGTCTGITGSCGKMVMAVGVHHPGTVADDRKSSSNAALYEDTANLPWYHCMLLTPLFKGQSMWCRPGSVLLLGTLCGGGVWCGQGCAESVGGARGSCVMDGTLEVGVG